MGTFGFCFGNRIAVFWPVFLCIQIIGRAALIMLKSLFSKLNKFRQKLKRKNTVIALLKALDVEIQVIHLKKRTIPIRNGFIKYN